MFKNVDSQGQRRPRRVSEGRRWGVVMAAAALAAVVGVEEAPAQTGGPKFPLPRLLGTEVSTEEEHTLEVEGFVSPGAPWVLERSLSLGAPGTTGWFPWAAGQGAVFPEGFYGALTTQPWVAGTGQTDRFYGTVQAFPLVPSRPPVSGVGAGPRVNYTAVQGAFVTYQGDGKTVGTWVSGGSASGSTTVVKTKFSASELNMTDPHGYGRLPAGVNVLHGEAPGTGQFFQGSAVFWYAPGNSPSITGTLGTTDARIRSFYLSKAEAIREDLFPVLNQEPPPPPSPVTVDQRSFFRLRVPAGGGPLDTDGDGRPNALEGTAGKLIFSEVCFLSLAELPTEQVGEESVDWVELWNPTDYPVSTADYYLSDDMSISASQLSQELALPLVTVPAGGTLVVYCSAQARTRLAAQSPPPPELAYTAPFDLSENGEAIYLYKRASSTSTTFSVVSSINPPSGGVVPPNVSYGVAVEGSTIVYGWFQTPTPGQPNAGWRAASGPLALPVVEDGTSPPAAPVALKGRFFNFGVIKARLRHTDPQAVLVYTLNGQEPTEQSAIYDGKLVEMTGTTVLRVKAFKTGALPSRTVTRSFLHLPAVTAQAQPGTGGGAPVVPVNNPALTSAYGESGTVPPALAGYAAAGRIPAQLTALPSVCLSFSNGLEANDPGGTIWPDGVPVSIEYLDPANAGAYFQENAGATISGNHSGGRAKKSWSLRFRKAFTLQGTSGVEGPKAADGYTSAIFPGSRVRGFSRLLLRNSSSNSWHWTGKLDALYLSDAYMKETDRALGSLTAQRRWVHLWVNGVYWGLYDFEEFMDADWVSRHLNAAATPPTASNPSPAANPAFAPSLIEFFNPASQENRPAGWLELTAATANAVDMSLSQSTRDTAWNTVQQKLDITAYIDYVLLQGTVTNLDTFTNAQFRAWKHPQTGKWRVIGWDGDWLRFRYGGMHYNEASDQFLSSNPNATVYEDLKLHGSLKQRAEYRTQFAARLASRLKASSTDPAPPLTQTAILARFDAQAAQVRSVLECEAMRWIPNGMDQITVHDPTGVTPDYTTNQGLYTLSQWATAVTTARTAATAARKDLKDEAREGRLLNDIPPPTITISGNTATITRPGTTGRIYALVENYTKDPKYNEMFPSVTPSFSSQPQSLAGFSGTIYITARIYAPDIDGQNAWSAPTVLEHYIP